MANLLISHYRVRAVCQNVMTKAFSLKNIAEHGKLYFQGRDSSLCAAAERARIHLRSGYSVQKALGPDRTTERRVIDEQIARAAIFFPDDFARCKKNIGMALDGILASSEEPVLNVGEEAALSKLFPKGPLRNKWCINIINLLGLTRGG